MDFRFAEGHQAKAQSSSRTRTRAIPKIVLAPISDDVCQAAQSRLKHMYLRFTGQTFLGSVNLAFVRPAI